MEAFQAFYKEQKDRLFAYLVRMTGNGDFSADLLQEAFTRYLDRYGQTELSPTLLYTIARNALFDEARKTRRRKGNPGPVDDGEIDQERRILIRDEYRRVLKAMERLEPEERDVLSMVVSSGLSYREIAGLCGISEANVKVKVHRARLKLREYLETGGGK